METQAHPKPTDETWREKSHRIRYVRAGGRCERCGARQGSYHPVSGKRVRLVTAIISNDPTDTRDENLICLCRTCQLAMEREKYIERRAKSADRMQRRLLIEAGQLTLFEANDGQ